MILFDDLTTFIIGFAVFAYVVGKWADNKNSRICPFCKETIKKDALICPHCRKELPPEKEQPKAKPLSEEKTKYDFTTVLIALFVIAIIVKIAMRLNK